MNEIKEVALLVGCQTFQSDEHFKRSLDELASLTHTAKGEVFGTITQKRPKAHLGTYVGKGKLEEIQDILDENEEINVLIFNNELSPSQLRNLTIYFGMKVVDRTQLILDIFAMRANTKEGKLQVESAQLKYLLPRLIGEGAHLSRQGGGIGTRGPGETKLESDRRHIRKKMAEVNKQLEQVKLHRSRYRAERKEKEWTQIAIVGYTNAGKSTLFNRLTNADTLEENLLFATLDTTTRKYETAAGFELLLSDTVGFIQDLPTTLVAAFRSTLEEVLEADFIVHVIDTSNPDYEQHEKTVTKLLEEIGVENVPVFKVYNKIDEKTDQFIPDYECPHIEMSALNEKDLLRFEEQLLAFLVKEFAPFEEYFGYHEGGKMNRLKKYAITEEFYFDEEKQKYFLKGYIPKNLQQRLL